MKEGTSISGKTIERSFTMYSLRSRGHFSPSSKPIIWSHPISWVLEESKIYSTFRFSLIYLLAFGTICHFTVVYSVTRPMNGSEAAGDLL